MLATAAAVTSGGASPSLVALLTIPVPRALLSTSSIPGRPAALVITRSGCTVPTTASPYFGSGSRTECPPATSAPASATVATPARSTRSRTLAGSTSSCGQATRLRASSGAPPIA